MQMLCHFLTKQWSAHGSSQLASWLPDSGG